MPSSATAVSNSPAPAGRWLTVIGIGEDGLGSLSAEARHALAQADAIVGGERHLGMLPSDAANGAERHAWPSPMLPFLDTIAGWRGRNVVVLASGDPLLHGVAATLLSRVDRAEMAVLPAVSAFQLACAAMLWPLAETSLVSACGRPIEALALELFDGARIVLFSADGSTPAAAAALLETHGFERSRITILERLGSPAARSIAFEARELGDRRFDPLNTIAIEAVAGERAQILPRTPGLPDDAFLNDGQITRREIRALTLARLSPTPGALLWDVGAGSGSIGIEWMRASLRATAIALEPRPDRAARIRDNARRLGTPRLDVREGRAPADLIGLPAPDAVFIGGGASRAGVIETCWTALKPGGRLVVNAVTIETEARLAEARRTLGGDLVRLQIAHADAVGSMTGWRSARPITQSVAVKPR